MTVEERLSATTFLLGMAHGGIMAILNNCDYAEDKVAALTDLEAALRTEIERILYTNTV